MLKTTTDACGLVDVKRLKMGLGLSGELPEVLNNPLDAVIAFSNEFQSVPVGTVIV